MLYSQYLILMILSEILILIVSLYIVSKKTKKQLNTIVLLIFTSLFIWTLSLIMQIIFKDTGISLTIFEGFASFGACFLPIFLLFLGVIFSKTKIKIRRYHILLFLIPILSTILMFTNNYHHLMYKYYSVNINESIYGDYFYVHSAYSYICIFIGLSLLLFYIIKNSGVFSKQSLLVIIGILIPVVVNILATFNIIDSTVYLTPISFTIALLFFALAIYRFGFLRITPIALQRIVDRISDSYLVLNEEGTITDFNKTFLTTFGFKDSNVRNKNVFDFIKSKKYDFFNIKKLEKALVDVRKSTKTISFDKEFTVLNKFFHIEINTITSRGSFLGTLILFKDTTQHVQDMQTIKDNQDMLMEKERLASLGQLIGGIAHNLKTPIMSISGAAEGINDLIKEYESSIGDPEVTIQDHHDIAKDMSVWVEKIKQYTEYMSDVITAVKGQAVVMSEQDTYTFTIDELVKRVNILMKHELKNALIELNTLVETDGNIEIKGNVNSLVQVINNMITNAIQAYNGKTNETIELKISKEKSNVIISIKDNAGGLPKEVSDKLFKEMITTKGKNGTGLGLFMSYSNIRAHFNGNITFNSKTGTGTEFKIILPV